MIEKDTINLLRECDAGIKMGVQSIEDSLKYASNGELKRTLEKNLAGHVEIQEKLQELLNSYHDSGKEPPAMAKGMAWLKTNFKLAAESSDDAVADFITDGCNMGVKSLSGYLNNYKAADEKSKNIAKELICLEERLSVDMRGYLSAK